MLQPGRLETGAIISNIFAFRWAMAAGTRAGTLLYKTTSERAADLSEAEAAAGGGGAFIQGGLYAPESRRRWKKFFNEHAGLWDRGTSCAGVGLLYWNDQVFYEYPEHNAITHRLVHILAESQIPFDMVTEQNLGRLSAYKVVIAPMLRYLDDAQVEAILRYVRNGGKLVVVDPFATEDKWARPRAANPFGKDLLASGAFGAGRLLRLGSDEVPSRSSDYWSLMEERGNAFLLAREYLNRAREADIAAGVDFGTRFVRRMEKELQFKLRWCPEQTDPALYVHAYHIEGHQQRPERMVVHLVNYHIPIVVEKGMNDQGEMTWSSVTKSGEPVPSEHVQITVPLPHGCRARRIQASSPVEPVGPVKYQNLDGRVLLNIKIVKLYQAIAIDLERP